MNRLKREGELAKGRTDQGANKPGGECKAQAANQPGVKKPESEQARRQISQGRKSQGTKRQRGEKARHRAM